MGLIDLILGESKKNTHLKEVYSQGAVIVDVRSPQEFHSGHIKNSVNIPLQNLVQKAASLKQKNKPVITVCLSGARSSMAVNMLKNEGVDAYNGGSWSSLENRLN
jgi:rhodanese-related sulfurtransferase